jgi:DNA-binding transcriptional regulator/RsmH inhibitor MraZ
MLVVDPLTLWVFPEVEFHSLIIRAASAEPASAKPLDEVRSLLNRAGRCDLDSTLRLRVPSNLSSQLTGKAGSPLRLLGSGNSLEVSADPHHAGSHSADSH